MPAAAILVSSICDADGLSDIYTHVIYTGMKCQNRGEQRGLLLRWGGMCGVHYELEIVSNNYKLESR